MSRQKKQYQILIMLSALAITSLFCITGGGNSTGVLTATIDEIQGKVQTLNPQGGLFVDAVNGQEIAVNDQVLTHEDGRARVNLSNGTIIRVGPLSVFTLKYMDINTEGPFARLYLEVGNLWVILNGGSVDVETPAGLASVRGSYMSVHIDQLTKEAIITCLEGNCQVGNDAGTVNLVAGQKVSVENLQSAPEPGFMNDEDVNNWLANNPEATLIVIPLTSTLTALQGTPLPVVLTPTSCSIPLGWESRTVLANESFTSLAELYSTTAETLASGNCMLVSASLEIGSNIFVPALSSIITLTPTAIQCGPPSNWIIYLVNTGETLAQLAGIFNVSLTELQYANCMGDSTTVFAGMSIYVPNIVLPTATMTTQASITPTTSGGSTTNATFFNVLGPVGGSLSTCSNLFAISVTDPDGIDYVEVEYSLNDATFSDSTFVNLPFQNGDKYAKTLEINTAANSGPDVVFWRFAMADVFNNHQWFPELGTTPYSYNDDLECGLAATVVPSATSTPQPTNTPVPTAVIPDLPTFFSNPIYPADGNTVISCANFFSIDVTDTDGVNFIKMEYSINDSAGFPSPNYVILTQAGNTWSDVINIDTTLQTGTDIVYWRFWAIDGQGNYSYYPEVSSFSYTDSLDCIG